MAYGNLHRMTEEEKKRVMGEEYVEPVTEPTPEVEEPKSKGKKK